MRRRAGTSQSKSRQGASRAEAIRRRGDSIDDHRDYAPGARSFPQTRQLLRSAEHRRASGRAERLVLEQRGSGDTGPAAGSEHGRTATAPLHPARLLETGGRHDLADGANRNSGDVRHRRVAQPAPDRAGRCGFQQLSQGRRHSDVLDARTRNGELGRAVRERYQKHVKAILQVGDLRTNSFEFVLGYPAEIVPLTNPYWVTVGDTLAVRCLVDGKPVAQQLVIAGGERDTTPIPEIRVRTEASGVARFVIGTAGTWYVKFIHMVPVQGDSVNYESKWATLTFQVR